jgi:hypothetical protein
MFKKFKNVLLFATVFSFLSGFALNSDVISDQVSSEYTNVAYTDEVNGDLPDQH